MSAVTAQQAALRILLEDVEPLLQRAEAAATLVQAARAGLEGDLATLAALVQRSVDAPTALLEASRRLDSAAARIESAVNAAPPRGTPLRAPAASSPERRWHTGAGAVLLCLTSALCGAAAAVALAREDAAQAQLGRALQRGWPSLDAATRTKVEAVLRQ
ncbi:hypothetical protein ACSFBI_30605 [Variovorax sp. RB3P1]|uniref:hypothetical protein n=1 Tax=Variovorax sp. RB3P1 TaxID=3443732 RepID=UPI003F4596F7